MIKRLLRGTALLVLLALTWMVHVYHLGVFPPPAPESLLRTQAAAAVWIDKAKHGVHQLVLFGTAYERGLEAGRLTKHLLLRQERELNEQLRSFVPSDLLIRALSFVGIRWFYGIEDYFEPWATDEMYGVSRSAPAEYDYLLDGFTRQIAYHGLHEVGQMMVDRGGDDTSAWGCTVVAVPHADSWVVGRNFDFEGGRTFDSEKIMKWVFPDKGYAYLSVIWAGMVGAVTGVNEHGLYISINAAGSSDSRRHGTPSTLVLLKALQFAKTAEEAIEIFKTSTMFITDIFVVLDSRAGKLYRIEKSPLRMEVIPMQTASMVANHLVGKTWTGDRINDFRRDDLTSSARIKRGEELLKTLDITKRPIESVLSVLRDKGQENGQALHLGNRAAIDALIATHGVVYNAENETIFVSQGPGVSGRFTGFDLRASFEKRTPVVVGGLPRDPLVSESTFAAVRASAKDIAKAQRYIRSAQCDEARGWLTKAAEKFETQNLYYAALGDYHECKKEKDLAKAAWKKALALRPAYAKERQALEEKLRQ